MKTMPPFSPAIPERKREYFIGRDKELDLLENHFIRSKKKVAVISGYRAIGKTSLWHVFIEEHKSLYDGKLEVIYMFPQSPVELSNLSITDNIDMVVLEEIDPTPSTLRKIGNVIKRHPTKQFILVTEDFIKSSDFPGALHIKLDSLSEKTTHALLAALLVQGLPEKEILRIVELTKGQPFLIKLIAYYLSVGKYTISEIYDLITEELHRFGLTSKTGTVIEESSREFKHIVSDIRFINESLLKRIKLKPEDMYNLTPRQFEEFVAELMQNIGYKVDLTQATRDGGKDLIIARHSDIGNFLYYVECKRYSPTIPVGVKVVRELAGTISTDRITAGILVTSSYFSPDAIEFSEKIKHQMSLIDFISLKDWLNRIA